jgi:hypothetical protein
LDFPVFNASSVLSLNTTYGANWLLPLTVQGPRMVQFNGSLTFQRLFVPRRGQRSDLARHTSHGVGRRPLRSDRPSIGEPIRANAADASHRLGAVERRLQQSCGTQVRLASTPTPDAFELHRSRPASTIGPDQRRSVDISPQ